MKEEMSGMESLEIIQGMINKAKNQFSENGSLYLLWGWIVLVCSLGHFVLDRVFHFEKGYLIWSLTWIAAVYQIYYIRKAGRRRKVRTYTDDILGYVWLVFIVLMFLGFFLVRGIPEFYRYTYLFVLLFYGMPTFLSGAILRFRPLMIGGVICWFLSFIASFMAYPYHTLVVSLAVICAWIIPGYILQQRFQKDNPSYER